MLKFYRYHFVRRLWFLPAIAVWTYSMLSPFLETKKLGVFIAGMENMLMLPAYLLSIFVLTNQAEMEFSKCYGFGITRLCLAQVGPYLFSTILAMGGAVVLFPLSAVGVTAYQRFLIFASAAINVFALVAIAVFVRVLIRNLFGALGFELIFYYLVSSRYYDVEKGQSIFNYYFSLGGMAQQMNNRLPMSDFYINRLVVLAFGIAFTVGAILLMNKQNYSEGEL